jgi:hypothetical protein
MSQFLFDVEERNRLEQKGVLRRFSITCYGHQLSIEEIKSEKARKYKELKDKRGTKEYEEHFLSYKPSELQKIKSKGEQIKKKGKQQKRGRKTKRAKKETTFDPYNSKKSKAKTYKK